MAESLARRLRLVLVTPGDRTPAQTEQLVMACVEGGVSAVWLREPQLRESERRALYQRLIGELREARVFSLVSRDAALAAEFEADGVQLGHGSMTVEQARERFPAGVMGRSAHWPLQAHDLASDFLTLSPFESTPNSRPRPLLSDAEIREVLARATPRPVIALGGLDVACVERLPAGVQGIAVKRALCDASDPRGRAAQLRSALDAHFDFGGTQELHI